MLLHTCLRKLLWAGMQLGMDIQRRISIGDFADSKTHILKTKSTHFDRTSPLALQSNPVCSMKS